MRTATLDLTIGHGSLRLPALPEAPLEVDGGSINVAYDGVAEKVTLAPSTLSWRGSRITISGGAEAREGRGRASGVDLSAPRDRRLVRGGGIQGSGGGAR